MFVNLELLGICFEFSRSGCVWVAGRFFGGGHQTEWTGQKHGVDWRYFDIRKGMGKLQATCRRFEWAWLRFFEEVGSGR